MDVSFISKLFIQSPLYVLRLALLTLLLLLSSNKVIAADFGPSWKSFNQMEKAGYALFDENKRPLQDRNAQQLYVPASTTKLITALLAIQHWGLQHRFHTDFYIRQTKQGETQLLVKGFGDPFLVSEELAIIAQQLTQRLQSMGVQKLSALVLDVSFYDSALVMPGTSHSTNPYDAIPSALAANFNTINAIKKNGQILSAETQTPMVPSGEKIAINSAEFKNAKEGKKSRINLGADVKLTQRYFAELLAAFISEQGVEVKPTVLWETVANNDELLLRYENSRTLADVIKPMMKYSTNFIANQLALNLGVELLGAPATKQKVEQAYRQLLQQSFAWQEFRIEDGAGLSRKNRLAPNQLIDVLEAFKPYIHLLPEVERNVFAKSGSLIGVSTLAGYIDHQGRLLPFALMINQKAPYRFRNQLARELESNLAE